MKAIFSLSSCALASLLALSSCQAPAAQSSNLEGLRHSWSGPQQIDFFWNNAWYRLRPGQDGVETVARGQVDASSLAYSLQADHRGQLRAELRADSKLANDSSLHLRVSQPDGSQSREVAIAHFTSGSFAWSRDDRQLLVMGDVMAGNFPGTAWNYLVSVADMQAKALPLPVLPDQLQQASLGALEWSPDGKNLYEVVSGQSFFSNPHGELMARYRQFVYKADADGSNPVLVSELKPLTAESALNSLSRPAGIVDQLAVSPDGSQLALGGQGLYSLPSQGGELKLLSDKSLQRPGVLKGIRYPASFEWSPDSSQLLFSWFDYHLDANPLEVPLSYNALPGKLAVVKADGTGQQIISHSANLSEEDPHWSPDGKSISYVVTRGASAEQLGIYTSAPDGSGARQLSRNLAPSELAPILR